jgi:hypothetical protein
MKKNIVLDSVDAEIVRGAFYFLTAITRDDVTWTDGQRVLYEEACSLLGMNSMEFEEEEESEGAWIFSPVRCLSCAHEWQGVIPTSADPAKLECPKCHAQDSRVLFDQEEDDGEKGDSWKQT